MEAVLGEVVLLLACPNHGNTPAFGTHVEVIDQCLAFLLCYECELVYDLCKKDKPDCLMK